MSGGAFQFDGCGNVKMSGNVFLGNVVALSVGGRYFNPDDQGRLDFADGVLVHGVECDKDGKPLVQA